VPRYKILHITTSLGVGGAERLIADLARLMDKRRFQVNVCCTGADGKMRAVLEKAGSSVTVLNRKRRSSVVFPFFCADVFMLFRDITRAIRRERPDVVHTHLEANYIAPFCARRAGVRAIVSSFHSSVLLAPRGRWSVRNAARRAVLRRVASTADALVAGSRYAAAAAAELCGVGEDAVEVVPNAVDVSRVEAAPVHARLREELGVGAQEHLVATLGTLKEPKNHRLLIEAVAMANRHPGTEAGVSAVIVGTGREDFVRELVARSVSLGVRDKVHFLGYRDDAYSVLKACDLMVLPSLWEGLPVAALEGMAAGLPVLLSDIPPHRELVRDGVDGWLFRSGDAHSLAESMSRILADREARLAVARAGSEKVRREYDAARMARKCEAVYMRCLAEGGIES